MSASRIGMVGSDQARQVRGIVQEMIALDARVVHRLLEGVFGVRPFTRESDGRLALGGGGTPVDWGVEMVRFDQQTLNILAAGSLIVLVLGGVFFKMLKPQFFPKDLSYLSYVDVWLPPDAPLGATDAVAQRAETVIRQEAERFGNEHHHKDVLKSLTTFVGGGGPRFWFSVDPERQQLNYAQILVEVSDKHFTNEFVGPLQTALSREVPGARVDVRQLETGKPVGIPPDEATPDGFTEEDAREIRRWGEPPSFDFPVKDHVDVGEGLRGLDFATGAKLDVLFLPILRDS